MLTIVLGFKEKNRKREVPEVLYFGHSRQAAKAVVCPPHCRSIETQIVAPGYSKKFNPDFTDVEAEATAEAAAAEKAEAQRLWKEAEARQEAKVKAAEKAKAEQLSQPAIIANAPGSGQAEGSSSEGSKSDQKSELEAGGQRKMDPSAYSKDSKEIPVNKAGESKTISTPTTLENKDGSEDATSGSVKSDASPESSDSKVEDKQPELVKAPAQAGRKAAKKEGKKK